MVAASAAASRPPQPRGTTRKPPSEWQTGDQPMTPRQRAYLQKLCLRAMVGFDAGLSKAAASIAIDRLLAKLAT